MFFGIIIVLFFMVILAEEMFFLRRIGRENEAKKKKRLKEYSRLEQEEKELREKIGRLEGSLSERFLFYDLVRKIAPILDKKKLFNTFSEELKHLGHIDKIEFFSFSKGSEPVDSELKNNCFRFRLGDEDGEALEVITKSNNILKNMPFFAKLLRLCLERIKLYNKLQKISMYDTLTKAYNRRHFMVRYEEEFRRAEKFKFDVAFLMIDVDFFKKINDTYGHLVGDAVLREIAGIIRKNIREVDFLARLGGEEFSVVLPETDKTSAILAAERISSQISGERIKVFDETVNVTISVGLATFPQSALYPDVLIEVADKALYKAKLNGRNRAYWF